MSDLKLVGLKRKIKLKVYIVKKSIVTMPQIQQSLILYSPRGVTFFAKLCKGVVSQEREKPMTVERESNTMGEVLPNQKVCTNCNETKPKKQFHRVLTLAQSRALLRKPQLTKPHSLISALCKDCQKLMKRNKAKRPLTASEIKSKIDSGDIHPVVGAQRIKKKNETARAKKALGQKIRWQKERMKPVIEHVEAIRTEVAGYRARYYAYKSHLSNTYEQIISAQQALLDQHRQNYEGAKRAYKDEIKPRIPQPTDHKDKLETFLHLKLTDYFTPDNNAKVTLNHTTGMYMPEYDMTGCLVTARNDKWWRVVEDRGTELMVVPPNSTMARPNVLQKSSITGVSKLNEER